MIQWKASPAFKNHIGKVLLAMVNIIHDNIPDQGCPGLPGLIDPPDHIPGVGRRSRHIQVKLNTWETLLRIGSFSVLELPIDAVKLRTGKDGIIVRPVLPMIRCKHIEARSISNLQKVVRDIGRVNTFPLITVLNHVPILVGNIHNTKLQSLEIGEEIRGRFGDSNNVTTGTVANHSTDYQYLLGLLQHRLKRLNAGSAKKAQSQEYI